jgi:predicted Fe-Mo cluster-binding NifX family protein
MRLAVPIWDGRVSPVLDVARRVLLVEVIGGEATFQREHVLDHPDPVSALAELGVDVLVCGALSHELEERLLATGIEVVAEVRGEVQEVVRAYLDGAPMRRGLAMPGCHTRRRRPHRALLAEMVSAGRR